MQIYAIKPVQHKLEVVEFGGDIEEIKKIIGFDTIELDAIDDNGNVLYFDENCFLRDSTTLGRFQLNSLAPVAGVGVVVRCLSPDTQQFETPTMTLEELQSKVKFLTPKN
jgi:hypothetical protein